MNKISHVFTQSLQPPVKGKSKDVPFFYQSTMP